MANELKRFDAETTSINSYKNSSKANRLLEEAKTMNVESKVPKLVQAAYEYLLAGKTKTAVKILDDVNQLVVSNNLTINDAGKYQMSSIRAMSFFRQGELENCIDNHNEESCIIPLSQKSFHKLDEGSSKAIEIFKGMLDSKKDLNIAWLLNVAYMTLGKYPNEVPKQYLMPLSPDEKKDLLPKFRNVASLLNIDDNQLSGGLIIDDLNGNGFQDILVSSWSLTDELSFYVNNGDGTFTNKYKEAGLEGITGGLNMIHGDYNNDGYLDVFILRGAWMSYGNFPNSLLKNNGDGTFTDVTKSSGIYSLHPTQTACFADFNNDGYLDVFVGNESMQGINNPCELFMNNGNGTFTEKANIAGGNIIGFVKGVATSDYDNDGDIDVFLSLNGAENILFRNDKAENDLGFTFTDVSKKSNISGPVESFPTWFFDYDNDGLDDIFVSSFSMSSYNNLSAEYAKEMLNIPFKSETPIIYRNKGDGTFENVTKQIGLDKVCFSMGSSFGDLNNDGFLDFYLGTGEPDVKAVIPNRMFLNVEGKKFEEVTMQGGFGHIQKGHAVSFADIDNDGDQDVYAVMGGAYDGDVFYNALFENPITAHNWLKIKLEGTKTNHSAYGVKVELVLESVDTLRSIFRTVSSGSSFGENPTVIEIGFQANERIKELKILWTGSTAQTFDEILSNSFYTIVEGNPEPVKKEIKDFKFKYKEHKHKHQH